MLAGWQFASTADAGYVENDVEDDDLLRTKDEERPQVVVLDPLNDMNEKELETELEKKRAEEDRRKIEERKIVFKKPDKRKEGGPTGKTSSKRCRMEQQKSAAVSDTRLLSFNEDEPEES
ncbi:unnamed protein product [Gongylonema pulchrum]|uniref:DUF4604 domain-containing protein n=1 Tax=Gongylonema pulchrum TaxID=637853 RepID=A0A183DQE3_9BILA|nr:unnamed protein product [Gongylonema pulchrum]